MVYAYRATDAADFFQSHGRYTGTEEGEVAPVIVPIIEMIRKYDTQTIFQQFGKKKYKDERMFLQKIERSYIQEEIRPYIEKYVARVLDELTQAGYPLFFKGGRLDNFYKSQRLNLTAVSLQALLKFERTGEYTAYTLRLTDGKRIFYPGDYDLKILTRHPCRVLCGKQLFRFPDDFDGQRLQPFLQKRQVLIPKANEAIYFQRFILKNIRHEEIEVQGFEIIVKEVGKKAVLSLEREVFDRPVLALEFYYGDQRIPAWSSRKALVELQTSGDSYAFYKVNRDFDWEKEKEKQLLAWGMTPVSEGYFQLASSVVTGGQDKQPEVESWQKMIGWVREHLQNLSKAGFGFTQKSLRKKYYTGGWWVDQELEETSDWFRLRTEVVLDDGRRIPLVCFREHILAGQREYLLPDGTVFFIPEEWFAAYTDLLLFAQGKGRDLLLHPNQYALLQHSFPESDSSGPANRFRDPCTLPVGLQADLRPYQQKGYEWMFRLYRNGCGGCLADDMGLGKTLQTIALILKYRLEAVKPRLSFYRPAEGTQLSLFAPEAPEDKETPQFIFRTCLVVVPASLIHNWRNELKKFAPSLTVTVYAGLHRNELRAYLQTSDVVIITYHTLRNDIDYLARLKFGMVVADEAQILKNPSSRLHQAMMRISGDWFWALSGTPIENSLSDLWAIMHLVNRGLLGTHHFFRNHFIRPILADVEGRMSAALRKLIAPYILRRTKEEVLADLPELTSELVICEPEEEQRRIYETEQARVRNYILDKRENGQGLRGDMMILKALIRLRQIANHPRLVEDSYTWSSGKFREIFRMLEEIIAAGHKVLIFSSFVKYLNMVADEAGRWGWKYALLTGSTTDRQGEVSRFSQEADCRLFLISLKAGGVGLNLTAADYVFILDPWWNLAAENQAIGRAHRIGQKRAVFVYRFITAGTLEEKILALQRRKQQLADTVITPTNTLPLSDEELLEVL